MTARPFRYDFSLWYCLEDDPVATAISAVLRSRGFRGYVEHQDHVAGTPRVSTANDIIQGSRVAILLLSPRSVADPWFRRVAEWNIVHTIDQDGTKVIPVYVGLSPREGPAALRHLTALEYDGPFFQARLLRSLGSVRQLPTTPRRHGRVARC